MSDLWLQGGPFLEISLLKLIDRDHTRLFDSVLSELGTIEPGIEVVLSTAELAQQRQQFASGYPFDDDANAPILHTAKLNAMVRFLPPRRAILGLDQLSTELLKVDLWFYGAEEPAPEWNQLGVRPRDLPLFKSLLVDLFDALNSPIGLLGYELDATDLFETSDGWPDEVYRLGNLSPAWVADLSQTHTEALIARSTALNLVALPGARALPAGTLVERQPGSTENPRQ